VTQNTSGMRLLPNVIGVFLLIVGCAWALAGIGYIRQTAMSGSHLSGVFGLVAALAGVVILASVNRARIRLWRFKRSKPT